MEGQSHLQFLVRGPMGYIRPQCSRRAIALLFKDKRSLGTVAIAFVFAAIVSVAAMSAALLTPTSVHAQIVPTSFPKETLGAKAGRWTHAAYDGLTAWVHEMQDDGRVLFNRVLTHLPKLQEGGRNPSSDSWSTISNWRDGANGSRATVSSDHASPNERGESERSAALTGRAVSNGASVRLTIRVVTQRIWFGARVAAAGLTGFFDEIKDRALIFSDVLYKDARNFLAPGIELSTAVARRIDAAFDAYLTPSALAITSNRAVPDVVLRAALRHPQLPPAGARMPQLKATLAAYSPTIYVTNPNAQARVIEERVIRERVREQIVQTHKIIPEQDLSRLIAAALSDFTNNLAIDSLTVRQLQVKDAANFGGANVSGISQIQQIIQSVAPITYTNPDKVTVVGNNVAGSFGGVENDFTVGRDLIVKKKTYFGTAAGDTATFNGGALFNNGLSVSGNASFATSTIAYGDLSALNVSGTSTLARVSVNGLTLLNGDIALGDSSADTITINGAISFSSNLNPTADNLYDLGSTSTLMRWRYGNFGAGITVSNGSATSTFSNNSLSFTGGAATISSTGSGNDLIITAGQNVRSTSGLAASSTFQSTGAARFYDAVNINATSTFGDTTSTDVTYFNSRLGTSLIPTAGSILDLGEYGRAWRDVYAQTVTSSATSTITGTATDAAGNSAIVLRSNGAVATADLLRVIEGPDPTTNIRFSIDANGNIGVNTTTPAARFSVEGQQYTSQTSTFASAIVTQGQGQFLRPPVAGHNFSSWPAGTSNVSDATLYVNPASSIGDGNLIGVAVGGTVKFLVDAEGDIYGGNLILSGTSSLGTTTIAGNLVVQDNITLGDATSTDQLYLNARIAGHLAPTVTNFNDVGDVANNLYWRTGYFGTNVQIGNNSATATLDRSILTFAGGAGTVTSSATTTIVGTGGSDAAGNSAIVLRSNGAVTTADLLRIIEGPDSTQNIRFQIDAAGNIGVNTSTPGNAARFGVAGASYLGGNTTVEGTLNVTGTVTTGALTVASISATGNINPSVDNTYDLGTTSTPARWRYANIVQGVVVSDWTATSTLGRSALTFTGGAATLST
ncbi:MAG: Peptidase S74 protein, partial [Candidatus Magasanikbacteria bacterium]|nr:Peptidase S74 protein [Candidatus Magasanikbacteria bacterium]